MANITFTVEVVRRYGGWCVDTALDGQPVSSLGPLDTRAQALAVQQHQASAVRYTIQQHVSQLQKFMDSQKRTAA